MKRMFLIILKRHFCFKHQLHLSCGPTNFDDCLAGLSSFILIYIYGLLLLVIFSNFKYIFLNFEQIFEFSRRRRHLYLRQS